MGYAFQPGPLTAAAAAELNRLAGGLAKAGRLTAVAPLTVSETTGNKVLALDLPLRPVEFLRPTGTRVSGRYPALVGAYDRDANTWSDVSGAVWLVEPNGGALPSDRLAFDASGDAAFLTAKRVPAVYHGKLAATGVPVYLALIPPGLMAFWACVDDAAELTITPAGVA